MDYQKAAEAVATGHDAGILTAREAQIVGLMGQGLSNKEIARHVGIVEDTVKKHVQRIFIKLRVRRRTLVVRQATGTAGDMPLHGGSRGLTTRETEIANLVQCGWTNKQIAGHLGIMDDTVKKHLRRVFAKLGVHRRAFIALDPSWS